MRRNNNKTKKIAQMSLLFALAMVLSFLESMLPALPMLPPGVKLGLSNIVTMYTLFVLGPVQALIIAVLKSLFVFLIRGFVAFVMSLSGGLLSTLVMMLIFAVLKMKKQYLLVSIFGGISHNVGQLIAARFIISNQYVMYYLPVLVISGMIMGIITGLVVRVILPCLYKLSINR